MTRDHRGLPPDVTRPDAAPAPAALPASVEETRRRMATTTPVLAKPRRSFREILAEHRAAAVLNRPLAPGDTVTLIDTSRAPGSQVLATVTVDPAAPIPAGPRLVRARPEAGT